MTIRANGTIYLNDGYLIPVENRLITGEADKGTVRNSVINAFLDGAAVSVEFTNLSTGILWERKCSNGTFGIVEIDGRKTRKQKGLIEGANHKIHVYIKDKGDVEVNWEPRRGVEK